MQNWFFPYYSLYFQLIFYLNRVHRLGRLHTVALLILSPVTSHLVNLQWKWKDQKQLHRDFHLFYKIFLTDPMSDICHNMTNMWPDCCERLLIMLNGFWKFCSVFPACCICQLCPIGRTTCKCTTINCQACLLYWINFNV